MLEVVGEFSTTWTELRPGSKVCHPLATTVKVRVCVVVTVAIKGETVSQGTAGAAITYPSDVAPSVIVLVA